MAALVVLALAAVCYPAEPTSCGVPPGVWQPGMYWTYETSSRYHTATGGNENEGTVMVLALARTSWLGLEAWALAVVWRWVDGTDGISLFNYRGPLGASVRWPLIADALPGALTTSSRFALPLALATEPLTYSSKPVRVERVSGSVEGGSVTGCSGPDWLEGETGADASVETVTLIPGEPRLEDTILGEDHTVNSIEYSWTGLSTRHVGEALWSPERQWWVSAAGHEERDDGSLVLDYQIQLSAWGVLDTEELAQVLESAMSAMAAAERPSTDCIRQQLQTLGLVAE